VKPSNILLAPERAKLADFGLARSDGAELSDLTTPGTAVGTLAYLAPELLAGESATAAADIYALGVVAFVGLSGTLPRQAGSLSQLIATAHDPAARVSKAAADLGDAFDEPIAAALDPDPARRPEALTFASSLTTALGRARRTRSPVAAVTALPKRAEAMEDATTIAVPTAAPHPALPSDSGDQPAQTSRRLVAISVIVVLAALAVGLLASNQPRTASPTESTVPTASANVAPATIASPSPRASQLATPAIAGRALATLDEVDAAIADTTGRDGLKGNERNDLEGLAGEVRAALGEGDLDAASEAADALEDKVDDVVDELDEARASRLTETVAALVEALGDD
jgi:serine/threonine-protein kinase